MRHKFEPEVSESEPSVEPDVVHLTTKSELEIVSEEPSSDKEKEKENKAVKEKVINASIKF